MLASKWIPSRFQRKQTLHEPPSRVIITPQDFIDERVSSRYLTLRHLPSGCQARLAAPDYVATLLDEIIALGDEINIVDWTKRSYPSVVAGMFLRYLLDYVGDSIITFGRLRHSMSNIAITNRINLFDNLLAMSYDSPLMTRLNSLDEESLNLPLMTSIAHDVQVLRMEGRRIEKQILYGQTNIIIAELLSLHSNCDVISWITEKWLDSAVRYALDFMVSKYTPRASHIITDPVPASTSNGSIVTAEDTHFSIRRLVLGSNGFLLRCRVDMPHSRLLLNGDSLFHAIRFEGVQYVKDQIGQYYTIDSRSLSSDQRKRYWVEEFEVAGYPSLAAEIHTLTMISDPLIFAVTSPTIGLNNSETTRLALGNLHWNVMIQL